MPLVYWYPQLLLFCTESLWLSNKAEFSPSKKKHDALRGLNNRTKLSYSGLKTAASQEARGLFVNKGPNANFRITTIHSNPYERDYL